MAATYLSRFLAIARRNEQRMAALFQDLASFAVDEVMRRADAEGNIPRRATFELQQVIGQRVLNTFIGVTATSDRQPFQIQAGRVVPLSPYARALWASLQESIRLPVEQQANDMRRRLTPDLTAILRTGIRDPLAVAARQVSEMTIAEQNVFRPNPLARYDPPHLWVDPNGYRLSERIWNTAENTRRRLDLFLETAIREGRDQGATGIARDLEAFLMPGRQLTRTRKPYGIDVSFDAMRLARTEITAAHSRAFEASAAMNPFVAGKKWNLSRSHPEPDICDDHAAGGPNGDGVYPLDDPLNIPGSSHPHCLCYWTNAIVGNPSQILDELREDVRSARRELVDMIGPLQVERFVERLLSGGLESERALPIAGL